MDRILSRIITKESKIMENNEVEKVVIGDVEYEVNGLSDKAKISVAQLKDLQNQINISRMRLDQLLASQSAFMRDLREEVPKKEDEPSKESK